MDKATYFLYRVFLASFFLHLPERIKFLGAIRFDFVLVVAITALIFLEAGGGRPRWREKGGYGEIGKSLNILLGYVLISLPFVTWPGSVLRFGVPGWVKAAVFFYFTAVIVRDRARLKEVFYIFIFSQAIRVIEPLVLHVRDGYWGDLAYIGNGEFANRLSGAPSDIINPNELGFLAVTCLIFVYAVTLPRSGVILKVMWLLFSGAALWVLVLTASRSAFVVAVLFLLLIAIRSRHRIIMLLSIVVAATAFFSSLDSFHRDRYLSLVSSETSNSATVRGRFEGWGANFDAGVAAPIFGSGLGTNREANFNLRGGHLVTHNLYLEVFQELGVVGLFFFVNFLVALFREVYSGRGLREFLVISRVLDQAKPVPNGASVSTGGVSFTDQLRVALAIWLIVTLVFSLSQYNLSIYTLYLLAGLARSASLSDDSQLSS